MRAGDDGRADLGPAILVEIDRWSPRPRTGRTRHLPTGRPRHSVRPVRRPSAWSSGGELTSGWLGLEE